MWITTVYQLQIPVYNNFQSKKTGHYRTCFLNYFGMQRQTYITLTCLRSAIQWRLYLVAYKFISWLIPFWQVFKIAVILNIYKYLWMLEIHISIDTYVYFTSSVHVRMNYRTWVPYILIKTSRIRLDHRWMNLFIAYCCKINFTTVKCF